MSCLIFGGKGWIGSMFVKELQRNNIKVVHSQHRADNIIAVEKEIDELNPTSVVCMIGRTHGPGCNSIDFLEDKLHINVKDNLFAPMSLALTCQKKGIHFTYLGTGCIFSGYDKEYKEQDRPDFFGSGYSIVKGFTDQLMKQMNVLNLRIRMPIVDGTSARDFIAKIRKYEKIIDKRNSMTVLHDFFPLWVKMIEDKVIGTFNCTNPGSISHTEVLDLVTNRVDPELTYQVMSVEEQDKLLKAERSNNILDSTKINDLHQQYFGTPLPTIQESIDWVLIHNCDE